MQVVLKFSCPQCQRGYTVPDELVRGKSVKVRCRGCGTQIPLTADGVEDVGAEVSPVSAPSPVAAPYEAQAGGPGPWYAMLKGQQVGPMDERAFASRIRAGDFHPRTYVWRDGMAEWIRASEVPALARLMPGAEAPAVPPPPPPAEPAPVGTLSSPGVARSSSPGVASSSGPDVDPFAAFGSADPKDLPPPGEATMVAIAQAGVNKRNPPWKFALFVLAIVGGPAALFFGLANVEVRQIQVDAAGNEVEVDVSLGAVVAGDGLSGLGDLLLGKKKKAADAPAKVAKAADGDSGPKKVAEGGRKDPTKKPTGPVADPNDPYDDSNIGGKGPIAAKEEKQVVASSTFNSEGALKVFKQNASAFQGCVDMELKKNPNAKLGKLILTATVAPSGTVTGASIDKKDVDRSSLGECLRMRAKRMVFPPFDGEPTDVELPIVAGAGF